MRFAIAFTVVFGCAALAPAALAAGALATGALPTGMTSSCPVPADPGEGSVNVLHDGEIPAINWDLSVDGDTGNVRFRTPALYEVAHAGADGARVYGQYVLAPSPLFQGASVQDDLSVGTDTHACVAEADRGVGVTAP